MATKVLVVGAGAREHALAWRLARGAGDAALADREIIVAPGNAGIAREFRCVSTSLAPAALVKVARDVGADLVVVGPEQPLVDGVADALAAAKIPCFGPSREAARLEGSKAFMKAVCVRAGVSTASSVATAQLDDARRFIDERARSGRGVVVKADGLCAGKGVVVCKTAKEAVEVAHDMLGDDARPPRFGDASRNIVVEDVLGGQELSVFGLCDGHDALLFGAARDHKRLKDGDEGPNTGGMGAVAPLDERHGVSAELYDKIRRRVFLPVLDEMRARNAPVRGLLFAGLMVHDDEPRVLEFNVRFGDPETEALVMATPVDLLPLLRACAAGERLPRVDLRETAQKAAVVVVAAAGYPEAPVKGAAIEGLAAADALAGVKVFCAGVARDGDRLVAGGGRVLAVAGRGATFDDAIGRAYAGVDAIHMTGAQVRRDIGASVR